MVNYVFVGAEAEGYYSNSYVCEGTFLTEEYYAKNKEAVDNAFNDRTFHELDGKHSEVDGDLVVRKFDSVTGIVEFTADSDVSYETYHLTESTDDGEHDEHAEKVHAEIEALISIYKTYTYALTPEQSEKVKAFIEELTKKE